MASHEAKTSDTGLETCGVGLDALSLTV